MKKRIMWVGEASYLNTGFSTYQFEVLKRLHSTKKYEICEYSSYGPPGDQREKKIPWKYIPVMPTSSEEEKIYNSNTLNEFGEYKYEQSLLDFKPDIVINHRDWWMCLLGKSRIITKEGIKKISDISLKDEVLTHSGNFKKVKYVFEKREEKGNFSTIFVKGFINHELELTSNHPILAIKNNNTYFPANIATQTPKWHSAINLVAGDIVCLPRINYDTIKYPKVKMKKLYLISKFLFYGYSIFEKCRFYRRKKTGIKFVIPIKNDNYEEVSNIRDICKQYYNDHGNIKTFEDKVILVFKGRKIVRDLSKFFRFTYKNQQKKRFFSERVYFSKKREMDYLLTHIIDTSGGCSDCITLKSESIAWQIRDMFLSQGKFYHISYNRDSTVSLIYDESVQIDENYVYLPILGIHHENRPFGEFVYNFEVEDDNSYVSVCALHNCEFQERSPLRKYSHLCLMPTVDAYPQDDQWLSTFISADSVLTYSEWAYNLLKSRCGNKINLIGVASPAAEKDIFKPVDDKRKHKDYMGIEPDTFIVGTVMRNQKRKLYPDLLEAFSNFIKNGPSEITKNTLLYLHTAWPDVGWNIPKLLKETGLSSKCIFTYQCTNCKAVSINFFQDSLAVCRNCKGASLVFPTSHDGVDRDLMSKIYNCMDLYVQFANSEGFGMSQVEAAACGVPVMAVDYSAMSDVVRKLNGIPIPIIGQHREVETHCFRAVPSKYIFVEKLIDFLRQPQVIKDVFNKKTREGFIDNYSSYDETAAIWEKHIDNIELNNKAWNSKCYIHQPNTNIPDNLSNDEFVKWGLINIAGRPDLIDTYVSLKMIRDLNYGFCYQQMSGMYYNECSTLGLRRATEEFNRDKAVNTMLEMCEIKNFWEKQRALKCL